MRILTNIKNSAFAEVIARHRAEIIARRYYELKSKGKAKQGKKAELWTNAILTI